MKIKPEAIILWISAVILLGSGLILGIVQKHMEPIYLDNKKDECIKEGGQYSVYDYSMKDDNSDYRAVCKIPEYKLWEIKL